MFYKTLGEKKCQGRTNISGSSLKPALWFSAVFERRLKEHIVWEQKSFLSGAHMLRLQCPSLQIWSVTKEIRDPPGLKASPFAGCNSLIYALFLDPGLEPRSTSIFAPSLSMRPHLTPRAGHRPGCPATLSPLLHPLATTTILEPSLDPTILTKAPI